MRRALAAAALVCSLVVAACGTTAPGRSAPPIIRQPSHFVAGLFGSAASPTIGETLTASTGTWSNGPTSFAYQWQRCSGSCTNISGQTSSSYVIQSSDAGDTIDVIVTASNAYGSASQTSSPTGTVASAGGSVPASTSGPLIDSGTTVEGQTLAVTNGSWSNSPTSYTYQWQTCSTNQTSCANISGATASTFSPTSTQAGDTLRVALVAHNASGASSPAYSQYTATVAATASAQTDCFYAPGSCGYPDPNYGNVGVPPGTSLTPTAGFTENTAGATINAEDISGELVINANNVTVQNTRITGSDTGAACTTTDGSNDLYIPAGITGTVLSHDTFTNTPGACEEEAILNHSSAVTASYIDDLGPGWPGTLNGPDALDNGDINLSNSYSIAALVITGDHVENIYTGATADVTNSVLLNPIDQTTVIFGQANSAACATDVTVTASLIAGGGYTFEPCSNQTKTPSSSAISDFQNDRLARCLTTCADNTPAISGDIHGYYPNGGFFGVDTSAYMNCTAAGSTWTNMTWDDNAAAVSC